jgi:hypothetical protein
VDGDHEQHDALQADIALMSTCAAIRNSESSACTQSIGGLDPRLRLADLREEGRQASAGIANHHAAVTR